MILYRVQCSKNHVFDEWFSNSADYDTKAAAHEIICPECGDQQVSKTIMAPSVGKSAAAEMPQCPAGGCQGGCAFANNF